MMTKPKPLHPIHKWLQIMEVRRMLLIVLGSVYGLSLFGCITFRYFGQDPIAIVSWTSWISCALLIISSVSVAWSDTITFVHELDMRMWRDYENSPASKTFNKEKDVTEIQEKSGS